VDARYNSRNCCRALTGALVNMIRCIAAVCCRQQHIPLIKYFPPDHTTFSLEFRVHRIHNQQNSIPYIENL